MLVLPALQPATVRSVEHKGAAIAVAQAGDSADVTLQGLHDISAVSPGSVLCHPQWPVPLAVKLTARVAVLDIPIPILTGQSVRRPPSCITGSSRVLSADCLEHRMRCCCACILPCN